MAKTVTLTVQVDDTQFKQFVARFNAFSNQITGLNQKFTQINTNIQKAASSTNALSSTMKALWSTTKSLAGTVTSITTHFIKWGTLIAGIGAMLGMGGGLFGIDRLAASILQKRKQVLGLGGDFGKTQAAMIFGQGMLDNPAAVLENIRMGKGGSSEQLRAMMSLGVPFGTQMSPEDLLPKILESLQDKVKAAAPGTEVAVGRAFGANALGISDMDIARLKTMSREEVKGLAAKIIREGKEIELSKEAQKGWADLAQQFKAAKAAIESAFGEKLAALAKPLEELSKSFVHLVKVLLDMPIVEKIIRTLTKMLNDLAVTLKSEDFKKELQKFIEEASKWVPSLKTIKEALLSFAETLNKIKDAMLPFIRLLLMTPKEIIGHLLKGDLRSTLHRGIGDSSTTTPNAPTTTPPASTTDQPPPTGGFGPMPPSWHQVPSTPKGDGKQGFFDAGNTNLASFGGSAFGGSAVSQFIGGSTGGTSIGGTSIAQNFGGASQGGVSVGGASFGGTSFGGISLNAGRTSQAAAFGGDTNIGIGGNRMALWQGAARRSIPGDDIRGTALGSITSNMSIADNRRMGSQGGLDIDNWQMNRTASLVVRNVPGANMFMTASGMG